MFLFIRRDPVVPPRSPSRPSPLALSQDAELAAGRVAVADGPMRARLPVGGDIPAEWWRVPATLDLAVATDNWRLRVTRHVHEPAVASAAPEILREDDRLVFVDKPAGVPSCAAGVGPGLPGENNCVALLNGERRSRRWRKRARVDGSEPEFEPDPELASPSPAADELFAVNRVDKPVSGVWILAKGSKRSGKARAALNKPGALKRKTYLALVKGRVRDGGFAANAPLRVGEDGRAAIGGDGAKEASTRVWPIATVDGSEVRTLVAARLDVAGRFHQIRAHCAHEGHPIVGDAAYDPEVTGSNPTCGALPVYGDDARGTLREALAAARRPWCRECDAAVAAADAEAAGVRGPTTAARICLHSLEYRFAYGADVYDVHTARLPPFAAEALEAAGWSSERRDVASVLAAVEEAERG